MNNKTLLKKLDKLSAEELKSKDKILNIKKGDVLLINDLTSYSKGLVEQLKSKISIILYKKSNKNIIKELPFTCIDISKFKIKEDDYVGLIGTDLLEKEISKKDIIGKVVKEYKSQRSY